MANFIIGILTVILLGLLIAALIKPAKFLPFIKGTDANRRIIAVALWFAAIMVIGFIASLFPDKENIVQKQEEDINNTELVTSATNDSIQLAKFKALYDELLSFKDSPEFIEKGFGSDSRYNKWYETVKSFSEDKESNILASHGFVAGDLLMLGLEYVKSKGKETEYSKTIRAQFDGAFNGSSKQEENNDSKLDKKANCLGSWEITWKSVKNHKEKITIFETNGKYQSLENDKLFDLKKDGNKLVKVSSVADDYYIIKGNKLYIGDKSGDMTDMFVIKEIM